MAEPYDLRSNIKDKPGSQGTLFQVKDKGLLNPQQRWPRGYTPERQAAVQDALKDTTIMDHSHAVRTSQEEEWETGRYARYPQAEHRVVDTLARSTAPVEHLAGLRRIHDKPAEGHHATYWPYHREMGVVLQGTEPTSTGRTTRDQGEHAMLHELGHHVDNLYTHESTQRSREVAQGLLGSSQHKDGSRKDQHHQAMVGDTADELKPGIGEAVADNYYQQHFRSRGRNGTAPQAGHYEENFNPERLRREFPGYTDVRPPKRPHMGPQFQQGTLF